MSFSLFSVRASLFATLSLFIAVFLPFSVSAAATTSASIRPFNPNDGLEERVRAYFADIPVMIEIASCESDYYQFHKDGRPLHGGTGTMIGLFQISEILHRASAERFGWEIDTPDGNMAYARYLYEMYGTAPWLASKHCWGETKAASRPQVAITKTAVKKKDPVSIERWNVDEKYVGSISNIQTQFSSIFSIFNGDQPIQKVALDAQGSRLVQKVALADK